jgi:hypothetical protein
MCRSTPCELAERSREVFSAMLIMLLYPLPRRSPDHALSNTNKADVFFIIALVMALMPNTNVLLSLCSVGDPEPGGEGPYGGSRA